MSAKRSTTAKSARPAVERDGPARDSQIEEAARQAERHAAEMEAIFAAMLDGIIIYDADGRIVRMNRIAAEILGYSPEERERPVAERLAHLRFETEPGEPLPLREIQLRGRFEARAFRTRTTLSILLPHGLCDSG